MVLKSVYAEHIGREVKFGRKQPRVIGPHFRLRNYLRASMPPPPSSLDYSQPALPVLQNILGNNTLGDCVIAGGYHILGIETGNAGKLWTPSMTDILTDYSKIGGYVPGDPSTDQGCDEITAMNYWTNHGFADGSTLAGWVAIDPTNIVEVQTAQWLFEDLLFGLCLPDSCINPFPSQNGFVWGKGTPDQNNGHCIAGGGYNSDGVLIWTWGLTGLMTYAGIAQLCIVQSGGGLYTLLSYDQIAKGASKAGNGFAWQDLVSDFQTIGGSAPAPIPNVAPVPSPPAPNTAVTLAQAQSWVKSGLGNGARVISRDIAIRDANVGLAKYWPKST